MSEQDAKHPSEMERLRARAEGLRAVLDTLPLATAVKDRDGRILYANGAAAPGYGVPVDAMIGGHERDLLPPGNDVEAWLAKDREVIDSGRPMTVPGQRFRTRGGRSMILHVTRDPVVFEGVPAVMVTAMDVTESSAAAAERRKVERRMAEAQRLEGLGLMAGGIAHDFNNLLVGVFANVDLALRQAPAGSRLETLLGRIKTAADRLAGLSRQMLAYSGRGHVDRSHLDLATLAQELLDMIGATIPATIRLETSLPAGLPNVEGDRSQISQVIMNLVINASEAFEDQQGTIRIAVRREFLDSHRNASLAVRSVRGATEHICLEVSDDGPGMDEATRARIFDPFFTTKDRPGRGLGLAAVIGIVRAHQGALQVDSAPGEGTRMRMWLPLAAERERISRTERVVTAPPMPSTATRGSILIIDDEAVVREATKEMLEGHGYSVHCAVDGDAGVEAASQIEDLDLVLLDMSMPGRSATDTLRALRSARPALPVLLISGYTEPDVLSRLLEEDRTRFLEKPFSGSELLEALHPLLDASTPR